MLIAKSLPLPEQIAQGISILHQGGLVAYPTDTVYGLGAGINMPQAVARVYSVKGRPFNMALPLLLADIAQISEFAEPVPPIAWILARRFLPGGLTIVLHRSKLVPDIITAGSDTVAVRVPAHPVPIALIRGLGAPIVGTSANLSGKRSALTAEAVYSQFGNKIDFIIDGGICQGGRESTIIDVTSQVPVILREGVISAEELRQVCGNIIIKPGGQTSGNSQ